MARIDFVKQTATKPAFPELIWSKPENRAARGKLLIIGGNAHGFAAPAEAYVAAESAGSGHMRVLLPEAVRKAVGTFIEHAEYGSSNPSGSFAQQALSEWLDQAAWSDATLLAGDLGRNSETAIVLEKFLSKYPGPVTITKDAADYFVSLARFFGQRTNTTLVVSIGQLQKLATHLHAQEAFTLTMELPQLIERLQIFTQKYQFEIITKHHKNLLVAVKGRVSVTELEDDKDIWRVATAAKAVVWRLQNPDKPFEALTTSVI